MPKANDRNIYEERPWLNDDVQNRTVLRQIVGGGSDITVESITITENDTYIAPEGKAYSPVIVNVAGGSSDFSTAEVTVMNNSSFDANVNIANILNDGQDEMACYYTDVPAGESTHNVILFKGASVGKVVQDTYITISAVTGDVQNMGNGYFIVSGNGSITLTGD